jgi:hypothetical protein
LPVSRFNPVLVETSLGFVAAGLLEASVGLGAAMHKPIGRGLLFGVATLGALALSTEIDEVTHGKLGGSRSGFGHPGLVERITPHSMGRIARAYSDEGHNAVVGWKCGSTGCVGQGTLG